MANGKQGPAMRVKLKRVDGKDGTVEGRGGEEYTAKQVEAITVWDNEGKLSGRLAPGFAITYKGKPYPESYINIFVEDGGAKRASKPADDDF